MCVSLKINVVVPLNFYVNEIKRHDSFFSLLFLTELKVVGFSLLDPCNSGLQLLDYTICHLMQKTPFIYLSIFLMDTEVSCYSNSEYSPKIILCTHVSVLLSCPVGVELLGLGICSLNIFKLFSFIIKAVLLNKRSDRNT